MIKLTVSDLRNGLAEHVNRVAYGGERVIVRKHSKDIAALVPLEDLRQLEALRKQIAARTPRNSTLRKLAKKNAPPAKWLESDDDPFQS